MLIIALLLVSLFAIVAGALVMASVIVAKYRDQEYQKFEKLRSSVEQSN